MNHLPALTTPIRRSAALALALAVASAAGSPRDEIEFHPSEGARLTKTFEMTSAIELDDLTFIVDGLDIGEMMFGSIEASIEGSRTITVTDVYGEMTDGGPDTLTRTFDVLIGDATASFDAAGESGESGTEMESDLEGSTVVFTRSDDGYDVAFESGEGDESLLEDLREDMDLRFLLPGESVSEDDTWEVSLSEFIALLEPGGGLRLGSDDEDDGPGMEGAFDSLSDAFDEILEGSCTCTYKGMRDVDGVELAEVELEIVVSSAVDLTEMLSESLEELADESAMGTPEFEFADLNVDVEGTGVLLWNVDTGLLHSLDLSFDGELGFDLGFSVETPGDSSSAEASIEVSLSMTHSIVTE